MKIDTSSIRMDSERFYTNSSQSKTATGSGKSGQTGALLNASFASDYMRFSSYAGNNDGSYDSFVPSDNDSSDLEYLGSDLYSSFYRGPLGITSVRSSIQSFHEKLIEQIEELMERIKDQLLGRPHHSRQNEEPISVLDLTTSSAQPGSLWTRQGNYSFTSETESTTFSTTGKVTTADGRTIEFNMALTMSRSFTQTVAEVSEGVPFILTDPLVFNLDDAPETISDQQWLFDLDGDGQLEEISKLAGGNAFLALDRDGNGKVDNGTELFGATTGNGFLELAEFDEDGNGWIDENDSIYEELKVWRKDSLGNDVLTGLKGADIGAIYLGSAPTQFSHNSLSSNETQAVVRQSGFFLHESTGQTGLVQQIDFATRI